jgi:hypothetical protein
LQVRMCLMCVGSCGLGRGATGIELGESTALFSLSSDAGGGEGRGEEPRFYWISPLPNPLPARSSRGEGDRRSTFQCLIQWLWGGGLRAAAAGGTTIRATLGVRKGCAAAHGADIAARCRYQARQPLGETPTGATGTAGLPKRLGQRGLSRWPGIFLTFPYSSGMHLPAMQTVSADRKRPNATEVTKDAKIAENDGAREDARPPSWGTGALRAATAEAKIHRPRKGG